jgi:NTE family protein
MRASYALPGVFKPVKINGRWLFDGALCNPVPASVCRALGARYVIAVNLNADACGRGNRYSEVDGLARPEAGAEVHEAPPAPSRFSARNLLKRQLFGGPNSGPGISTVMVDAFNIVQDRIARSRLAGDPPDVIINPRLAGIGLFDFQAADALISRGMAAAQREVEDIRREIAARDAVAQRHLATA